MTSPGINREHANSRAPKWAFWLLHALALCLGGWLIFADGWPTLGRWAGQEGWGLNDPRRATWILACEGIYFLRHGFTLFYLMQRRVGWGEALGLAAMIGALDVAFLLAGGGAWSETAIPFGLPDALALALFALGSCLNTGSELQRKRWKSDPAHRGHCYTGGLFRLAMHINYFGDVLLFTGLALLTRNAWTLLVPAGMLWSFAAYHVPTLDAYLEQRYGEEFHAYRKRTKRLIPYVW